MSDEGPVVLRCPACGTTQGHEGECESCYEDQVRYFCSNHTPGLWLDKPACAKCGARFGDAPRRPAEPPRRSSRAVPPRARDVEPTAAPIERPPLARDIPSPREALERPPPRVIVPAARSPRRTLADLLALMSAKERERAGYRVEEVPREPPPEIRVPPLPIKGCIVRLVIFVLFLVALAVGGLFLLVGGSVQGFMVDLAQSTGLMTGTPEQTIRGIDAFRRGDLAVAEEELSQAAATYPRSALALLYLAKMRTDAGDLSKAGEYLETAVSREPNSAIAHRELGLNYLARARAAGRLDTRELAANAYLMEADRHFAAAASLNPADSTALGYRGCTLAELGAEEEAQRLLSAAGDGPWQQCTHIRAPSNP